MLHTHIATQIYTNFGFTPTLGQKKLIDFFAGYITDPLSRSILMINGYAGTGKTSIIAAIVNTLKSYDMGCVLLAPTGRAAKVMTQYSGHPAYTIHKKIYRQKSEQSFDLNFNKDKNILYIIDEASMLSNSSSDMGSFGSGRLIDDLMQYVESGSGCKLVIVGDNAQLPPVGMDSSPALDPAAMGYYGDVEYHSLTEVVRQGADSGILHNATTIRRMIEGGEVDIPKLDLTFSDFHSLKGAELIETIDDAYRKYGIENTVVITRSNKRAGKFNQGIRNSILDREEKIGSGDMIMIVKNNYFYKTDGIEFIANGDIAEIVRIHKHESLYGFNFANATIRLPDYGDTEIECKLLLDTLDSDSPSLSYEQHQALFRAVEEDYADIKNKRTRYTKLREDPYFNALQVKFAYAVTCHKAQGGQWPAVFVDQMIFGDEAISRDFLRWLYTAITRATEEVHLINFQDKFFDNKG